MCRFFDQERSQKQKTTRWGSLIIFGIAAFYALICTPVYMLSMTFYPLSDSIFPSIWDFVQGVVNLSFYWTSLGFSVYLAARYTLKDIKEILGIYLISSAGRYVLSLLISTWMMMEWSGFWYELIYVIQELFLDCCLMALAMLLIYLLLSKPKKEQNQTIDFQFSSPIQFSNSVLKCALAVSFIPALMRILARVRFDLFFGAPQSRADLIWIVVSYCGDILIGVIGYLVLFLMISQLYLKEEEAIARG